MVTSPQFSRVLSKPTIPGLGAVVELGGLDLGHLALQRILQGGSKLGRDLLPQLALHGGFGLNMGR